MRAGRIAGEYRIGILAVLKVKEVLRLMLKQEIMEDLVPKQLTQVMDHKKTSNFIDLLSEVTIKTVFHPIISMRDQRVVGLEALSRGVKSSENEFISPEVLFDQAFKNGQTARLDRECREKALANFKRLIKNDDRLMLWLNFEPSILDDPVFEMDALYSQVLSSGIPARRIVIEFVESKVANTAVLLDFVGFYKKRGFLIAVDDWGTAYSNMERIAILEPDVIKIHRSLISNLENTYHKQELVRSTINMAHCLGSLVVVEGVETEDAILTAMDLGASVMQGFYFCQPDDDWDDMKTGCNLRVEELSEIYKTRKLKMFENRRKYFSKIDAILAELEARIKITDISSCEPVLEYLIKKYPELKCLYLLDEDGRQLTKTICCADGLDRKSLFSPPACKGSDHSMGDFFIMIQSGLKRYVSEPYISHGTGHRCVTISQIMTRDDGCRLIICADCDSHQETTNTAHRKRIMGKA